MESFVTDYQRRTAVAAKDIKLVRGGHIFALDSGGELVFCSSDHNPASATAWAAEAGRAAAAEGRSISGHLETGQGREMFIAHHFKPWNWTLFYSLPENQAHHAEAAIAGSAWLTAVLAGLVVVAIIIFITQRFLARPIRLLRSATRDIASGGHVESISITGGDELGQLARDVESMSASLSEHRLRREQVQGFLENEVERRTEALSRSNEELTREVASRRQAERALGQSEERFRALFEQAPIPYQSLDAEGRIVASNRAWLDMMGYRRQKDVQDRWIGEFMSDKDAEAFEKGFTRLKRIGAKSRIPKVFIRRDGTELDVEIDSRSAYHEDGRFKQTHCVVHDVTAQKKAEREREEMHRLLRQSQKMEAIGTLAGGIAHDFNNILAAVLGYAELVQTDLPPDHASLKDVDRIAEAAMRGRDLVRQILDFARQTEHRPRATDIGEVVSDSLQLMRATIPANISIETRLDDGTGAVMADPTLIRQVVMNLCSNAAYALKPGGGRIIVSLSESQLSAWRAVGIEGVSPGRHVVLTVADNGPGIDGGLLDRIFEHFFTTKPQGQGTGMGLAVVHGIVRSHRGGLTVDTGPDKGTVFTIYLPRMDDEPDHTTEESGVAARGEGEHIMLVDDEASLSELGRRFLENQGYRVTTFNDGRKALAEFSQRPGEYDLVVTDQTMPRLTGLELAAGLLELKPELPVVLCTGYSEAVTPESVREAGLAGFLMKPVASRELARIIRTALQKADALAD